MSAYREDIFFCLDLTTGILKKKDVIKALKFYIEEKSKINHKAHYCILIFQEKGNPILIKDKKDWEIIVKSVSENWQNRLKNNLLGSGLFYILSYIAETTPKKSKINRVIVMTDMISGLSDDYKETLFDLVSKIKDFPTFIDILRIYEKIQKDFIDDDSLDVLASQARGSVFYIKDKKEFMSTIKNLAQSNTESSIAGDNKDLN
ncbi:MAG: hypothetical protein EU542_04145 [Promethearchaeota archaeon]|nr:MAG: hypothetical protein EU542_04145 [Candidatus Lokiarchaeota archaeon]